MTTLKEATNQILTRWATQWGDRTQFVYDNEAADELDGGSLPWARVTVTKVGEEPEVTMGSREHRRSYQGARIYVQIFVLTNTGTGLLRELTEAAAEVFEAKQFGGVNVDYATERDAGPTGKWQLTVVELPFHYEEFN